MSAKTPADLTKSPKENPTDRWAGTVERNITAKVPFDVPGYELPVLIHLHGADHVFLEDLEGKPAPDAEYDPYAAHECLLRKYTGDAVASVRAVYPNGPSSMQRTAPKGKAKAAE